MLKVYGFSRVNEMARGNTRDLRVLWALEELEVPYEIVGLDHPNHDLDDAAFRAKNVFGQVPVIDDDGVIVSESGAVLLYLARKYGRLMPSDLAGEAQVLRWSIAALNTVELPVLAMWFVGLNGGTGAKPHEALRGWGNLRLQQLDGWMQGRSFVATDAFSVADILMAHVLSVGVEAEMLAPYTNLRVYVETCLQRPAWVKTRAAYEERVEAA
ncbi:MAG TPA: glutathione S-transferase family protein [Myxococcota bacterium]